MAQQQTYVQYANYNQWLAAFCCHQTSCIKYTMLLQRAKKITKTWMIFQIRTTIFLIRAIQAVLVSITNIEATDAAMIGTQEVVWRACGDG